MKQYRKKPVIVEAVRLDGTKESQDAAVQFIGSTRHRTGMYGGQYALEIYTLEGVMLAKPGDYIIKGVKREFYPCAPDIFAATYEEVLEESEEYDPATPEQRAALKTWIKETGLNWEE